MPGPVSTGYARANGVQMYWESRGEGGTPLVVVHGGFGLAGMFGDLLERLAASRRVIAIGSTCSGTPWAQAPACGPPFSIPTAFADWPWSRYRAAGTAGSPRCCRGCPRSAAPDWTR